MTIGDTAHPSHPRLEMAHLYAASEVHARTDDGVPEIRTVQDVYHYINSHVKVGSR